MSKPKKDKNWRGNKDVDKCGITNQDRASRVEEHFVLYATGRDGDLHPSPADMASYCADMIADLLHLAASEGWDAERVLRLADLHFQSER